MKLPMRLKKVSPAGLRRVRILKLWHNEAILYGELRFIFIKLVHVVNKSVKYILSLKLFEVFYLLVYLCMDI
jgi:hypothetical protein